MPLSCCSYLIGTFFPHRLIFAVTLHRADETGNPTKPKDCGRLEMVTCHENDFSITILFPDSQNKQLICFVTTVGLIIFIYSFSSFFILDQVEVAPESILQCPAIAEHRAHAHSQLGAIYGNQFTYWCVFGGGRKSQG